MKIEEYTNNFFQCIDTQYKFYYNIVSSYWYKADYKDTRITIKNLHDISYKMCVDRFHLTNEIEKECSKKIDIIDNKYKNFIDLDYEYKKCFLDKLTNKI